MLVGGRFVAWSKCDEWFSTCSLMFIISGDHIFLSLSLPLRYSSAFGDVDFDLFLMKLRVKKFSATFLLVYFSFGAFVVHGKNTHTHICLFFNWLNKFSNKKTNANLVKTQSWCFFFLFFILSHWISIFLCIFFFFWLRPNYRHDKNQRPYA